MKPKPLSALNHFTVPVAISSNPLSAMPRRDLPRRPRAYRSWLWNRALPQSSSSAPAADEGKILVMNHARRQGHRVYAALYDWMTGPLEQGGLGTRRSGLLADLPGEILASAREPGRNCRTSATPAAWSLPNPTP